MIRAALRMEIARIRSLTLWTAVVAAAYTSIVAGFYPTFRDNQKQIDQYMELFPKDLLKVFGMSGSLADPGNFFNSYIGGMLWPIVGAMVAIALATRPVAADLERGFLELPLATRLSRIRYLGVAIAGQFGALVVVSAAMIAGMLVVGRALDAPFDVGRFSLAGVHAVAFGCAIAGPVTLLAVVTLDRGRATGISVGLILAMYLLDAASKVWTDLEGVASFSLFSHFQTLELIDDGVLPTADFVLLVAVAVVGWGLALLAFRRRDLAA